MNYLIISIYDSGWGFSVCENGKVIQMDDKEINFYHDIFTYNNNYRDKFAALNFDLIILCENGNTEILKKRYQMILGIETIKKLRKDFQDNSLLNRKEKLDFIENAFITAHERIEELEETNHLMYLRELKNTNKLKAIEILINKKVDIQLWMFTSNRFSYNKLVCEERALLEEEHELLKEVLL